MNATLQRNQDAPVSYEGKYSTDVIADKAHGFLNEALEAWQDEGTPFFLTIAPTAPHSDVNIKETLIDGNFTKNSVVQSPPIPAERHKDLFKDLVVPRTPNFNPDEPHGASWISGLPKQNQTNVDSNDDFYRNRIRSLQAVDEMVDTVMNSLADANALDDTYIFYSTDNGYHIGQHRLQPGKQCAFEEDINVPMIVRGPDVPKGRDVFLVTTHIDLAPTFLRLAGATTPVGIEMDGQPIPLSTADISSTTEETSSKDSSQSEWSQEHVNVEMWGIIMPEGKYGTILYPNHTYKAVRVMAHEYNLLYTVWCNGEHELYDLYVSGDICQKTLNHCRKHNN